MYNNWGDTAVKKGKHSEEKCRVEKSASKTGCGPLKERMGLKNEAGSVWSVGQVSTSGQPKLARALAFLHQ